MQTILVTGGGGFIGSNLVAALCRRPNTHVVVVDRFGESEKWRNLKGHRVWEMLPPEVLPAWLGKNHAVVDTVFHVGAVSSTTERNIDYILENNLNTSINLWRWCNANNKRFIYTSSAATYGDGSAGFEDDISLSYLERLKPLSGYGWSKHLFDMHIASATKEGTVKAPQWAGLKIFNTYGPNEYHKADQRSVICQIAPHAIQGSRMHLFRSYNSKYGDGEQMRDVIYVKDCVDVLVWMLDHPEVSGLFNLGTGKASSFNQMAKAIYASLNKSPSIHYIDMPDGLVDKYQYFTEAKMERLRAAGYTKPFTSLEEGVKDYVTNYLIKPDPYL